MAKQNPFQQVVFDLVGELKTAKERAQKSKAIPFGMEQVTKREAQGRAQTLTRADLDMMDETSYQELVQALGSKEILNIANRGANNAQAGSFSDQLGQM